VTRIKASNTLWTSFVVASSLLLSTFTSCQNSKYSMIYWWTLLRPLGKPAHASENANIIRGGGGGGGGGGMPLIRTLARTTASGFWWWITVTPKSLENHRKNQDRLL
jgi:hypothetical protein